MSYITLDDFKANLISGFDILGYIVEADEEIIDVCQKLGVRDLSLIKLPICYKLRRYGVAFVLMRLAQDKIGTNQADLSLEKYQMLFDMYKAELKDLYSQITYEMITGTVSSIIGRTQSFGFYRG